MYCNFMLMSVNVCRDWLKKVDIDWDRVNVESNIDMECSEDDEYGHTVSVTVHYEDGRDAAHHTCQERISCCVSGDFSADGIPLRKFVDTVKKADGKMMLLCSAYGTLGRSALYEFSPIRKYLLSDVMVECNNDR